MNRRAPASIGLLLACATIARAQPATTRGARLVEFPNVVVDLDARQVRVACESLALADAPLEFLCVTKGGPEHESVLRTSAKPSHVHAGLLMLGLEPGVPATYRAATNDWRAPFGPPVRISCEWTDANGARVRVPAERTLAGTAQNQDARPTWIFAGSHVRPADGAYLADLTGYVVTLVNFEHALIDVPRVTSSRNETLEWRTDLAVVPPRGTTVTMVLDAAPAAATTTQATTSPATPAIATPATQPDAASDADAVDREIAAYRDRWRASVAPHEAALRAAARAHADVIGALRRRQQALVDEADHLQRLIDDLDREFGELATPRPGVP